MRTMLRAIALVAMVAGFVGCSDDALPPSAGPLTDAANGEDGGLRFDKDGVIVTVDAGSPPGDVPDAGVSVDVGLAKDTGAPVVDAGQPGDAQVHDAGPGDSGPIDAGCPDCCTLGVCCDDSSGKAKAAGTPCGQEPTKVEFKCEGSSITRREGFAGCDGVQVGLCSSDSAHMSWSGWQEIEICPGGKSCIPAVGEAKPTCPEIPVECKSHGDCADAKACSQDLCDAGKCLHLPASEGTPCGDKTLATEYKCSSTSKGGAIQVRDAVAGCDGKAETCPADGAGKAWKPWSTYKKCDWNKVCKVEAPDKPGTCGDAPKCTPKTTCCDADGKFAATGAQCDDKIVDEEFKCEGPIKGGKLMVRNGYKGCAGSSTWCSSYSSQLHWKDWQLSAQCKATEKCKLGYNGGSGKCDATKECAAKTTCCGDDGFYAAKGTKCGKNAYKTEAKCLSAAKGGKISERKAYGGCTGTSTWCSNTSDNLVWGPWEQIKACKPNEACEPGWSAGVVNCKDVGVCSIYSSCCTEAGEYALKGYKCSDYAYGSEKKCESEALGGKILQRKGYGGCSGKSSSCSSSAANLVRGEWEVYQTCGPKQVCKATEWQTYCQTP